MKKNKLIVIISAICCVVIAGVVMAIALKPNKHEHGDLGNARVYHVLNDEIYYTRTYQDGCVKRFNTEATFEEVLMASSAVDSVRLEEDVVLNKEVVIKSFVTKDGLPQGIELNINLDLNNHTLSTNVESVVNNSVFTLNSNYGTINLNVENGKLYSQDLLSVFKFINNGRTDENVELNITNVECTVVGSEATPLFAHNNASAIKVNGLNSKFISKIANNGISGYGVGAYINSASQFNFNNCYFEGGDAIYVKHGQVNLTSCKLVSDGLDKKYEESSETFCAVGACVVGDTYTSSNGSTEFEINIIDCEMIGNTSSAMIYIAGTAEEGQTVNLIQILA